MVDDWNLSQACRANVLVVGAKDAIDSLFGAWLPYLDAPMCWWQPDMVRPPSDMRTVIVSDIAALTETQQHALQCMLREATPARFISISTQPLYERVRDGRFPASLYYQLNTLYFVL